MQSASVCQLMVDRALCNKTDLKFMAKKKKKYDLQQKKRPETELASVREDFFVVLFKAICIYFLFKLEYKFSKLNSTIQKQKKVFF